MNIANNIKAAANAHGKTISSLATEMGVAQSHLSRTINNERISLKDMEALATLIGCEVSDFFNDNPSPTLVCPKCGARLKLVEDKEE
ncbi:MAG: helix-turn-helix domain-containing protein [Prevotella sp.]|nr:helix-turn-helix domain-containing protein [Prevotella sp.]